MTKIQLPLFEDKTILPTGKHHISYSEYSIHKECSYRHKLQYIEKLSPFEGSIHTSYGKAIHDAIEKFLITKQMLSADVVKQNFKDMLIPLAEVMTDPKELEKLWVDFEDFSLNIAETLEQVPTWLNTTFPGWKIHSAEFNLFESLEQQTNLNFKGFIDAIIMVPKKERKNAKKNTLRMSDFASPDADKGPIEYEYWIIDWKTCQFFWAADKRRDFKTQMQLVLYKYFFCRKFNIPLKNVKCGFALIRRKTTKTSNERLQIVPVSAGDVTITRALQEVNLMVNSLRKRVFLKNRSSCRFCPFYQTKFCT